MEKGGTRIIPFYTLVPPHALLLDIAGPLEVIRYANGNRRISISTAATSPRMTNSNPPSALGFAGWKAFPRACRKMRSC